MQVISDCQSASPDESASSPKIDKQHSQADHHRCRRKTHSKSRKGCLKCKKRRVKCNEKKPQCSSCALRGYECIYPSCEAQGLRFHFSYNSDDSMGNLSAESSTNTRIDNGRANHQTTLDRLRRHSVVGSSLVLAREPSPTMLFASPISTQHQMRLLHHYLTVTAGSFSMIDGIDSSLWTIHIPKIAFSAQHTMNALLTVAASHMKFLDSADKEAFDAELYFRQLVLSSYNSSLLEAPSIDNWERIASTGILLYLHSWSYIESEGELDFGLDGLPCLTWRTRTMLGEQWLHESSMSPFWQFFKLQTRTDHPRSSQVPLLLAQLFPDLSHWSFDEMTLIADLVADLLPVADALQNNQLNRQILLQSLSWGSMRSPIFVDSLRRKDTRSLLLVGVYYCLLEKVLVQFPECWFAVKRTFEVQNGLARILREDDVQLAVDTIFVWLRRSEPVPAVRD